MRLMTIFDHLLANNNQTDGVLDTGMGKESKDEH